MRFIGHPGHPGLFLLRHGIAVSYEVLEDLQIQFEVFTRIYRCKVRRGSLKLESFGMLGLLGLGVYNFCAAED